MPVGCGAPTAWKANEDAEKPSVPRRLHRGDRAALAVRRQTQGHDSSAFEDAQTDRPSVSRAGLSAKYDPAIHPSPRRADSQRCRSAQSDDATCFGASRVILCPQHTRSPPSPAFTTITWLPQMPQVNLLPTFSTLCSFTRPGESAVNGIYDSMSRGSSADDLFRQV